ncbi:hypothetical protein Zm00014a_008922 [Zea mays]|uniref:Uncharacterized protein n=2 Tax=Zea mays TaxID=4577 RepID=A0A1D6KQU1_MAIZE|nr:hypothetical protein ZEAMMB73_Zm00001d032454 [Zea mays]ONM05121.1 hypothetical protein ZEAMMB73_Zm00001d032454 [Zea mays]ONM05122.1 hypothetical protein ZEAMMB73_Zm00001d032454 [Zea mays]PWZ55184.1 hypothetical protein Zm00014a_008922 [Zea mays]
MDIIPAVPVAGSNNQERLSPELMMFNSSDQFFFQWHYKRSCSCHGVCQAQPNFGIALTHLRYCDTNAGILLDFVGSFEHHECKCLGIAYVRGESITENSEQQKGLAHDGISMLCVSDWSASVLIYYDPLRGLVLA